MAALCISGGTWTTDKRGQVAGVASGSGGKWRRLQAETVWQWSQVIVVASGSGGTCQRWQVAAVASRSGGKRRQKVANGRQKVAIRAGGVYSHSIS